MKRMYSLVLSFILIHLSQTVLAQDEKIIPERITTSPPVIESMSVITERQANTTTKVTRLRPVKTRRDRSGIPDNPFSPALPYPSYPYDPSANTNRVTAPYTPQTISTDFNGVTGPTETGAFPP
ncbi:MAG TPA: hypothetical protein VFD56_09940, partial [Chitinophagaceae bacterium]|nr:hypothetical protein [Chitinophagaceae bacterium]